MTQHRLATVGITVAFAGMAALGLVEAISGDVLQGLHPFPDEWTSSTVRFSGASLLLFSVGALRWPIAASGVALHWTVAALFVGLTVVSELGNALAWAPLAQTLAFAAFAMWVWRKDGAAARVLARMLFGLMLLLFGAIHLTNSALIAGLIPDFVPGAPLWPWATGGVQVLAGVACLVGRGVPAATLVIAMMYAAWLPIVHAPRLFASQSTFEWTFALTALALAGVSLAVGGASGGGRSQLQDRR